MNQELIDNLWSKMQESDGFPTLSKTIASVFDDLHSETVNVQLIVDTISKDFTLTQKVLKLVNSAMYASFTKDKGVTTISRAVQVLGCDAIVHLALSVKVLDSLTSLNHEDGTVELEKTLLSADIARDISSFEENVEIVSISTLLYNLGVLLVSHYLTEEHRKIQALVKTGVSQEESVLQVIGISYQELGAEIARRWKFPESLIKIIDGTSTDKLMDVVKFSNVASSLMVDGKLDKLEEHISNSKLEGVNKEVLEASIKLKINANNYVQKSHYVSEKSLSDNLTEVLEDFNLRDFHNINQFSTAISGVLYPLVKAERFIFFSKTKLGEFRIRDGAGKGLDSLRATFKVPEKFEPTIIHAALKRNVDVFIKDVSKIRSSAPNWFSTMKFNEVSSLLIMPIVINDDALGFLYFDWVGEMNLIEDELIHLRKIRDLFLKYFHKI